MIVGWGSAMGILAYCVVMLLMHPEGPTPSDADNDNDSE